MKIVDYRIYRFSLKLKKPLMLKNKVITSRQGLLIKLTADEGGVGWGEASPLPQFSQETLGQAERDAVALGRAVLGAVLPPGIENLGGAFADWPLGKRICASVRFGFESAVLHLQAAGRGISLLKLLGVDRSLQLTVNGLLSGAPREIIRRTEKLHAAGYKAYKLKVGRLPVAEEIALITEVRKIIGQKPLLRLDANRAFDLQGAREFMDLAARHNIEYVEEPVKDLKMLKQLTTAGPLPLKVALDESLLEIGARDLEHFKQVKALVLKPTLLGLEKALEFAALAGEQEISPVISSTFESSWGIFTLAHLAAAINDHDVAVGLDTLDWFEEDLVLRPLSRDGGRIHLALGPDAAVKINSKLLTEVRGVGLNGE